MKHIKYIAILIVSLFVSCTENDIVPNNHPNVVGKNQIQLVTRIAPFTEHDVTSRAVGDNQSVQYDFIIFGTDNTCVYYNHCYDEIINIDRANDFPGINQDLLNSCTIYVLTNYSGIYKKICQDAQDAGYTDVTKYITEKIVGGEDIDYFAVIPTAVLPDVNLDESALPRIGSITGIDLSGNSSIGAGTIYTVDLQSLFSKMVFDIKVEPTETNAEIFNSNTFQLLGYRVNNLPKSVDLFSGEVGNTHDILEIYDEAVEGVLGDDVNLQPTTELSFTLYLPERFFKPTTSADNFNYPFGKGNTIREEDKNLRQRYKPLLAKGYSSFNGSPGTDNKATYVTISGIFTNHQGHTFDVNYDVYVGKDNYGNFDVVRNMQYNNTLTIKGIHNSSNQDDGTVSVDHRVNVTHTRPIHVSLRRETLLDAHFEVRPLRIRKNTAHGGDETHVKVEVVYSDNQPEADGRGNWISLERSFGDGKAVNTSSLYCVDGSSAGKSSAGKRKYFTYDLVNKDFYKGDGTGDSKPLHTSTELIFPMPAASAQECVWIYVDECTEASRAKDAKRSATIKVTCGKKEGDNFIPVGESLDYTISQHKLFEINCGTRTYCIEHEEEYLYNFDNEDSYVDNKTEFNGMPWGLDGKQLSNLYPAIHLDIPSGFISSIIEAFGGKSTEEIINGQLNEKGLDPKYDFYIPRDITNDKLTIRAFSGYYFNQELATYIKKENIAKIEGIALDEIPQSAFAYCYNRNKRDRNGNVVSQNWYMPAIDELEEIMTNSYLYFTDFHGQYYWSCQPAYERYNMSFDYYKQGFFGNWENSKQEGFFYRDNIWRSRATKVQISESTGDFEDIISSGSEVAGVQYGEIRILYWEPRKSTFTLGSLDEYEVSYDNHPGNKLRTEKCRVRAVYKP